jgi:glucose-1-phosphate cytidylyltransferase
MKVVILAGGLGTRISEETHLKPKPMIEIGSHPIIWHIMKTYSYYGFNEFIICCGYKGYIIKEYFANYYRHMADLTVDLKNNSFVYHNNFSEPWKVTLVDTGVETMTGGRIKRIKEYLNGESFMLTYGDGVSNINIRDLLQFHQSHGRILTVTSVQPEGRFGALEIDSANQVLAFKEKPKGDGSWINVGFFVCGYELMDYIQSDTTILEREPLEQLASIGEVMTFKHHGFWRPMDTLRDKNQLEQMVITGNAPWIKW